MAAAAVTLTTGTGATAGQHPASSKANLAASSCQGPAGAAFVADAGWDGFSAIDTATCKVTQTYNVGDRQVPNDPGDYDYDSADEALAIHGHTLYFADTGNSTMAVIDASKLDPSNYNPDGQQLWVGARIAAKVVVLNTADGSAVGSIDLGGEPNAADCYAPTGIALTATPTAGS